MSPVGVIIKVFEQHIWFDAEEAEVARLKADANKWWGDILTDDEAFAKEQDKKKLLLMKVKKFFNSWYAKMLCAVLYLWLMREVGNWLAPSKDTDNDNDD